jgi:MtN3 and saliva related transmembrane protein
MADMTLLAMLATVTGTAMAVSGVFQSYRIFKRKSAGDVSIITYSILTAGGLIWILYGMEISNFPIIITNSIGLVVAASIVIGWFLYGKERKSRKPALFSKSGKN